MSQVKTRIAILVLMLLVGGLGLACSQRDAKPDGPVEKIRISALPIGNAALLYIAQAKGYFKDNGLEVTLKFYQTGPMGLAQLKSGQIDVAHVADFVLVDEIFKGSESLRCLGSIAAVDNIQMMGRKDEGILQPGDLKGKRIGVPLGTIAEFFLGRFLTFNSISLKDVACVNIIPANLAESLEGGRVDAVMVWEPWVYEIKRRMGDKLVSWSGQTGQRYYNVMVSSDQFIKAKPAALERLFRALNRAEAFMKDNLAEGLEIIAQQTKFDKSVFQAEWLKGKYRLSFNQSLLLTMEDEGRWMINSGLTDQKTLPNYLNYIYPDALYKVKPNDVTLILPKRKL
jgi:ABC-type nitrate/sulfonate/bicarbonate transport system substrate-binding protein